MANRVRGDGLDVLGGGAEALGQVGLDLAEVLLDLLDVLLEALGVLAQALGVHLPGHLDEALLRDPDLLDGQVSRADDGHELGASLSRGLLEFLLHFVHTGLACHGAVSSSGLECRVGG